MMVTMMGNGCQTASRPAPAWPAAPAAAAAPPAGAAAAVGTPTRLTAPCPALSLPRHRATSAATDGWRAERPAAGRWGAPGLPGTSLGEGDAGWSRKTVRGGESEAGGRRGPVPRARPPQARRRSAAIATTNLRDLRRRSGRCRRRCRCCCCGGGGDGGGSGGDDRVAVTGRRARGWHEYEHTKNSSWPNLVLHAPSAPRCTFRGSCQPKPKKKVGIASGQAAPHAHASRPLPRLSRYRIAVVAAADRCQASRGRQLVPASSMS
eukprot:105045-Chlamydomonas_euryale.AAC.3